MALCIVAAILLIYAAALSAWWSLRPQRSHVARIVGIAALFGSMAGFIVSELAVDSSVVRAALGVLAALTAGRMYSYWMEGKPALPGEYFRFISFSFLRPYLVYPPDARRVRPHIAREIARLLICIAIIPAAWSAVAWLAFNTVAGEYWSVDHVVVLAGFVIILTCAGQCFLAIWRLQGLPIRRPIVDNILAVRTPADFWRRWNWPPHAWLWRDFYTPAGGRRRHVLAVMLAFLVSGIAHELLFALATRRITGHQTLFFLLNGVGVAASPQLERLTRLGWIGAFPAHHHPRVPDRPLAAVPGFDRLCHSDLHEVDLADVVKYPWVRMIESEQRKQAIAMHHAGRLPEAEAIYRQLLARQGDDADLLNLLGCSCIKPAATPKG